MDVQALRWGVRLGQNLYTPADLHESSPQPEDRPYAAWLFCAMTLQRRGETFGNIPTLDSVALDAGVVGPAALGKELQDFVHRVDAAGWSYQLRNEPAVDVEGARIWKFSSGDHQGWSLQFLPQMGVRLGTLQVEGSVGAQSRAGYAIPRDFGRHTLDDATPETGGFSPNRSNSFHVYLLVGAEAKVVGWNMLLDGNIWHDSPSVHKEPVVADFTAGIVVGWKHFEVAYIHVFRTQEFQRQSEVDSFGSLALSWHP